MTVSMRAVWEGEDKFGSKKFRALNSWMFGGYAPSIDLFEPVPRGRGYGNSGAPLSSARHGEAAP
jgi:pantoate kinase